MMYNKKNTVLLFFLVFLSLFDVIDAMESDVILLKLSDRKESLSKPVVLKSNAMSAEAHMSGLITAAQYNQSFIVTELLKQSISCGNATILKKISTLYSSDPMLAKTMDINIVIANPSLLQLMVPVFMCIYNESINVPYHTAARQYLLYSKTSKMRMTPLHYAAGDRNCDEGMLDFYIMQCPHWLNAQADDGSTPLHMAAYVGNKDAVQLLLDHGADQNIIDMKEQNPWQIATDDAIKRLLCDNLDHFWMLDTVKTVYKRLHKAVRYHRILAVKKICCHPYCFIDAENPKGLTALMIAAKYNYEDMVTFLLNQGADLNYRNIYGDTALSIARKAESNAVAELLRIKGALDD